MYHHLKTCLTIASLPLAALCGTAHASEGGSSLYLLGSGGPGTAVMPPLEGVYFDDSVYIYNGSAGADKQFVVGGNVVAGLDATIVGDFLTTLAVPSTNFLGGTLAIGAIVPVGAPMLDVNAVITGPLGNQRSINVHDSALVVGDPVGTVMLGWKAGKLNIQASTLVNVPIGHYREDQLANLAFHRWAVDGSLALSWHDDASGWDISGKGGVTFNGKNDYTDYNSGNEFHLEGAVEKALSKKFSMGVQGYWLKQISDDTGAGARLGAFRGEIAGVGATAALNVVMGRSPATFRLRAFKEFDATNRLEGEAFFLSLSLPLYMKMPKQ
ncbi:transporter [Sphingobium sp. AP49]|uniref:SphA family protein n=1 Tax=Sphingobium sp. AP49 TaxID=1144307 RepID=UPI00026EDAF1|nr:transporter [Sphingobium sp. AP49]WHO37461.1 transporter [Sphingobium sp. AP49]